MLDNKVVIVCRNCGRIKDELPLNTPCKSCGSENYIEQPRIIIKEINNGLDNKTKC